MEPLNLVATRLAVGEQASEQLPDIAASALVRGLDSPALRVAAGVPRTDVRAARDAFEGALRELGIPIPEEQAALWVLTRDALERMIDGSLNAYVGASWIWRSVYHRFDREGDLRIFVGLASEWDDHPGSRTEIEDAIRRSAGALLAQDGPRAWLKLQARVGESPVIDSGKRESCAVSGLPVSDDLKRDLLVWADEFDAAQARPGSGPSGFESVKAAESFVDRGARMVDEMQRQLGVEWHVEYMPTPRAFPPDRP